jgi:hypothetical protein
VALLLDYGQRSTQGLRLTVLMLPRLPWMVACSIALLQFTTSNNADTIANPCACSLQDR